MVTVVTMFEVAVAVSETPSPSSRPSQDPKRIFVPTEQFADCTVDRQRKSPRFFSASGSNVFRKTGCCPCRDLQSGSPLANIGRGFRRSRILAFCPQAAHGTLQPVRMKVS